MAVEVSENARPAAVLAVQVIVGSILFALLLLVAFGLSVLVHWMETRGAPIWMIQGAGWAEWAVFWLDLFTFALFLLSEVLKFMAGLYREWR